MLRRGTKKGPPPPCDRAGPCVSGRVWVFPSPTTRLDEHLSIKNTAAVNTPDPAQRLTDVLDSNINPRAQLKNPSTNSPPNTVRLKRLRPAPQPIPNPRLNTLSTHARNGPSSSRRFSRSPAATFPHEESCVGVASCRRFEATPAPHPLVCCRWRGRCGRLCSMGLGSVVLSGRGRALRRVALVGRRWGMVGRMRRAGALLLSLCALCRIHAARLCLVVLDASRTWLGRSLVHSRSSGHASGLVAGSCGSSWRRS